MIRWRSLGIKHKRVVLKKKRNKHWSTGVWLGGLGETRGALRSDSAEPCRKPVTGQNKTAAKAVEQSGVPKLPTLGQDDGLKPSSDQFPVEFRSARMRTTMWKSAATIATSNWELLFVREIRVIPGRENQKHGSSSTPFVARFRLLYCIMFRWR